MRLSQAHKALMRSIRFGNIRYGIELTTIPPSLMDGRWDYERYSNRITGGPIQDRIRAALPSDLVKDVHADPGCIEIPSRVLSTWGEGVHFTNTVLKTARRYRCKQESPHQIGGGGHIHISRDWWCYDYYDGPCKRTADSLQGWLTAHPWVAWAFNDPSDNWTARLGHFDYDCACSHRGDQLEFRFFDAAESVEQQVEHVACAVRLMQLANKLPDVDRDGLRVKRPRLAAALAGWEQSVEELRLPWNLYSKYSRNIRERYQLGWRYLN